MKKKMIAALIAMAVIFVLASCASKPKTAAQTKAEIKKEQNELNVTAQPMPSRVLDWSNRNMGEPQVPPWLKSLLKGNSQSVKQEFGLNPNARVKYSLAQRANRDEARVSSTLLFNQQIATELKNYVVTAAAQTLNQGQMDIIEEITTATKVVVTGNRNIAEFWQLVETTDDRSGSRSREYLYYIVWSMEPSIWDQIVRKYVNDVIGKIPDRQVQTNVANAYNDIAAASRRETELSDRDFQFMVDERTKAAENAQERELARIRSGAAASMVQADSAARAAEAESKARYAAYKSGNPTVVAIASTTAGDVDWIKALSTAAQVNY
jgi:hypothetical protein